MYPKQSVASISSYLSSKLKILSFLLIILVLYIHSGFHADEIGGMPLNIFVQALISDKIGRAAVPLFFIISGYLFFFSLNGNNLSDSFKKKIKARISSLVVPYIIGCLFCVCFFLALENIPFLQRYLNSSIKSTLSGPWPMVVKNIFWKNGAANSPLAFHLWFLRDLIILVFCSPAIYYLIRYTRWILVMALLGIASFWTYNPQFILLSVFWFSLGATIALERVKVELDISNALRLGIFLLVLALGILEQVYGIELNTVGTVLMLLLGVISLWLLYDFIFNERPRGNATVPFYTSYTFFIYIYHEPAINIVRKLFIVILGKGSGQYLISYLFSPILFAAIAVAVGFCIKKIVPAFFSLITGGRG